MTKTYTFYCSGCDHKFKAAGQKKEWTDPIYGPCWKRQAECSQCGQLVDQHKQALSSRSQSRSEPSSAPTCAAGTCPFAV